jgi:glycosyltransferase involved in cell wall biosynthesis
VTITTRTTPAPAAGPRTIRVASVPASHVYVRHLSAVDPDVEEPVRRLPDPDPADPRQSAEQRWWPPVMLDPDWIRAGDFDVFHLQFGFDAWSPEDLTAVVAALRETGRPLVYTVHDLRNPHHRDRALHDRQLDVLVPAADAVVTLTPGAAAEIGRRWGRTAEVLPHPHVVPLGVMETVRRTRQESRDEFRVGLHVKSLRESMAPLRILPSLLSSVRSIPGGVLQVNGHRDVLEAGGARYDAALASYLAEEAPGGGLDVRVHDFMSDDELWRYLSTLDASVLPYRFGTHSGWAEACRDLGTTVIAPTCGYYAEQGPALSYVHEEDLFDAASLVEAVHQARLTPHLGRADVAERRAQRTQLAAAHARLYRSLL